MMLESCHGLFPYPFALKLVFNGVGGIMGIRLREWLIERLLSITILGIILTLRYASLPLMLFSGSNGVVDGW